MQLNFSSPRRHRSRSLALLCLLIGICILCSSAPLYGQGSNVWEGIPLSSEQWQGTVEKFQIGDGGLYLADPSPRPRHNEAWLIAPYSSSLPHQLQGEVSFSFTPSSYNHFYLLLYPYTYPKGTSERNEQNFVALSIGRDKVVQLITLQKRHTKGEEMLLTPLSTLLNDHILYRFDNSSNHLSWRISWNSQGRCTLWLNTHNSLQKEWRHIGSIDIEPTLCPITQQPTWGLYIRYTKKQAKGWQLLRWKTTNSTLPNEEPTPNEGESPFDDISYTPQQLTLHCKKSLDISHLKARLEPYKGTLHPEAKDDLLYLHLSEALSEGRYRLTLRNLYTPQGNLLPEEEFIFSLEEERPTPLPSEEPKPETHPLLSEVMYYPLLGGSEYIELFNPTGEMLDLKHFGIALRTEGRLGKIYPIQGSNAQIPAGQYKAITAWKRGLEEQFHTPTDSIVEVRRLPNLPNRYGQIALVRLADTLCVEEMLYTTPEKERKEQYQGMAWARISFSKSALNSDNWRRVRGDEQYGSPGRCNTPPEVTPNLDEKESNTPRTPHSIAQMLLRHEREKGFKAQAFWYAPSGEQIAYYPQEQLLRWCREVLQGKAPLPPHTPHSLLILAVEMRTEAMRRWRKMHLFFR